MDSQEKSSHFFNFRQITVDKKTFHTRLAEVAKNLDDFLFSIMASSFRSFRILPEELCEDRSLNDIESSKEEEPRNFATRKEYEGSRTESSILYPIYSKLLKSSGIVLDRGLNRVPFPILNPLDSFSGDSEAHSGQPCRLSLLN